MPPLNLVSSDDFATPDRAGNFTRSDQLPARALTIGHLSETPDNLHLPCKVLTSAKRVAQTRTSDWDEQTPTMSGLV